MKETSFQRINNVCLIIIAAAVIMMVLIYTKIVMIPLVVSLFIFSMMIPVRKFLKQKTKMPHILASIVSFLAFLGFFALVIIFITNSLGDFLRGTDVYQAKLIDSTSYLLTKLTEKGFSVNQENIINAMANIPLLSMFSRIGTGLFSFVSTSILVIVFVLFLIAGKESKRTQNKLILEIENTISQYISIKLLISAATGLFAWIVLAYFNVELAFMFAFLTFLLNFIPSIGSIIATALPLPVLFLQFGFGVDFFTVLFLLTGIQFTVGQIIEPKVMGYDLDLHPVTLLCCLIFWGLVWGVVGMFLAVPITAVIKFVLDKLPTTKAAAELMAGRLPRK
ncbi:MAG: AI-2E family transporter [Elusimicrobiaceae bacterium]|nr:AI-2E family transporter [Elusimicrobiaceae bacterium]MBT4007732.1 AI-2E family transporter [Elusimicrobiaceae bacterium]MBT4439409.1 AI-2E family transporter [Elusimicrobiaceae bacterium]MBT5987670.1 AI-2E family transporter [Elusimicrobiaceae bacterium]MBT6715747.1 AI-2E family transporter [Elusimicrobiaceae bacterium]